MAGKKGRSGRKPNKSLQSNEDIFIDNLNLKPEVKQQVREAFNRQVKDNYDSDPASQQLKIEDLRVIRDASVLGLETLEPISKKSYVQMSGREVVGYSPAGSILRKLYPGDFKIHSFLSEAYWAYVKARKELWVETDRDGYALIASQKVSQKDIKLIHRALTDLKVPYWRNKMRDTVLVMGNCIMDNVYNKQGGLLELRPLLMERLNPRTDFDNDVLLGWDYQMGNKLIFLPADSVDNIHTYNSRSFYVGAPACNSIIVDLEAALQAAIYNNNLMRKGGLISAIIRMRDPANSSIINDKVSLNLADEFSTWMERRYAGIRGAGGLAFIPNVDGVDLLNKIGEMDTAWHGADEAVSRKTCLLLGVPPERCGIINGSQYKNVTNVADNMALSFDNNNYYVLELVDQYLTKLIIQDKMGIEGVKITSSGEFSAISKIGAEVGMLIATMGVDIMRVDEFRTDVLHIDPLGGELGQRFLGEYLREETPTNEAALTRAVGQGKHLFPQYQEFRAPKIKYTEKELRYMI